MTHHPPVVTLPETLWHFGGWDSAWKDEYDAWAIADICRAVLTGNNAPIQPEILGLIPYLPDLLAEIGPSALTHVALRDILFTYRLVHPFSSLGIFDFH